tara:strand:- start:225 stop:353 length:129 start_codon:yes stop_codon:yes gene_type:complete
MEIINHITGFCGEPHLNINILFVGVIVFFLLKKQFKKNENIK